MNSATKVGEIFTAAGNAFSQLGELTMQLHTVNDLTSGSKWTDEEIEMLHKSIVRFSEDLNQISQRIKGRTVTQIRQTLKKKAFEEAGIPLTTTPPSKVASKLATPGTSKQTDPQDKSTLKDAGMMGVPSEITLNRLNTSHGLDVDAYETPVKLEFEAGPEEVTG